MTALDLLQAYELQVIYKKNHKLDLWKTYVNINAVITQVCRAYTTSWEHHKLHLWVCKWLTYDKLGGKLAKDLWNS